MLFALMITDGAGRLALIVAAGISILFEGEMNHGSNLKCERLFSSTHLSIPFPCALHTTQRCRRLHTHTHTSPWVPTSCVPHLFCPQPQKPPRVIKDRGGTSEGHSTPSKVIFHWLGNSSKHFAASSQSRRMGIGVGAQLCELKCCKEKSGHCRFIHQKLKKPHLIKKYLDLTIFF